MLGLAEEVGADRVELANTQYYGWAWRNRDALLPSRAQLEAAEVVLRDRMDVVYVLPCPAAQSLPLPRAGGSAGADLGRVSGDDRVPGDGLDAGSLPVLRAQEVGSRGCRCQAFQLTGDAARTDPVCHLSPDHDLVAGADEAANADSRADDLPLVPARTGVNHRTSTERPRRR